MEKSLDIFSDLSNDYKSVTAIIDKEVEDIVKYLCMHNISVATAESCTGGLISSYITSVPGASKIFSFGICSYANEIKEKVLGVDKGHIEKYGVVNGETAIMMAKGAMRISNSLIGVSTTGIAGPDGGTDKKPVGTVYVAVCYKDREMVQNLKLYEAFENLDRDKIRTLTVFGAFRMIKEIIGMENK